MSYLDRDEVMEVVCDECKEKVKRVPGYGAGIYQCFHCGQFSVIWDNDFTFEDYGMEGEGLIHVCHCGNCGAEIEYQISEDEESEDEKEKG